MSIAGPTDAQGSNGPQALAQELVNVAAPASSSILFVPLTACAAIQALMTRTPLSVSATSLTPDGPATPCIGVGAPADIVISEVFAETCAATLGVPTTAMLAAGQLALKDSWGPVEVTTLATPLQSTERAISADAAYVVFGFGGSGSIVAPWSVPASILAPNRQSSLLDLVSTAVGLAPSHWATATHSTVTATSAAATALRSASLPSSAIGLLPSQVAEANADTLRILAYQHTDQSCGYLPSSDGDHFDKINVREGRYALWGPLHVFMAMDIAGNVVDHTGSPNPVLTRVASLLTATGPATSTNAATTDSATAVTDDASTAEATPDDIQSFVAAVAQAGMIPWCAMNVLRTSELGAESSYQPPLPCRCSYENLVGAPTSSCMACRTDADCNGAQPVCRFGFCEVQ